MDSLQLVCDNCGARYRLPHRPPQNRLKCKKCGSVIDAGLPPRRTDRTGQTISGYRILERLSEGERADVYRAEQLAMRRTVALKVLADEYVADKAAVDEFIGTARAVAAMSHPAIVSIYDVGAGEVPCFSMEFVEGRVIRDMLEELGPPPPPDAVEIAVGVGNALTHALQSRAGEVRIATDTVMLTDGGEVKILPSAFCGAAGAQEAAESRSIVGLGKFLYALLTGIEPSPGARKIDPPSKHNPGVSAAVDRIVLQMMKGGKRGFSSVAAATRALKRPSGMKRHAEREALERLERVRRSKAARNRKAIIIAAAVCVVCAAAVVGGVWFILRRADMAARLNDVRSCFNSDNYAEFIEAAEDFIRKYPSHPAVEGFEKDIASVKEKLHAGKRRKEAQNAIGGVLESSVKAPHLVKKHQDELDEIARLFSDVEGIENMIAPAKDNVLALWRDKRDDWGRRIRAAAKEGKFADAYKKMEELRAFYADPAGPGADRGEEYLSQLRKVIDKYLNHWFYTVVSRAWNLQQNGKTDEAIKLYQDIIDTWGSKEYADRARKRIERLRGEAPEPEEDNGE